MNRSVPNLMPLMSAKRAQSSRLFTANQSRGFLLVAATATGGLITAAGTLGEVHTEGPKSVFVPRREKLSIYDAPQQDYIKVDEPSPLELAIRLTRWKVTDAFSSTRAQVQTVVDEWLKVEAKISETIQRYVAPEEKVIPGAIYVTLAGFAGSIVAKQRSLPARFAAPTAFATTAFIYLYPRTSRNITNSAYQSVTGNIHLPPITDSLPDISGTLNSIVNSVKSLLGDSSASSSFSTTSSPLTKAPKE
ncbi:apolipo protein O-domain-containing protein [Powellomyces hirtus]|nr:apolipo protein O-domain-containing protein [Powellomyces hirtus]